MLLMILKKIFFKLMIISVYGKTMEYLRRRMNVRLVNNEKDFVKNLVNIMLLFMKLNQF